MRKKILIVGTFGVSLILIGGINVQASSNSLNSPPVPVYRLYNKNTGEHLYTESSFERDNLIKIGWTNENIGWQAPKTKGTPVYRVYNPNAKGGDHYYTASKYEAKSLVKSGWKWDNNAKPIFYSGGTQPVYVAYNPFAKSGAHNYTTSYYEQNSLLNIGWKYGKVSFYGMKNSDYTVDHTSIKIKNSILYVGDKWQASDNFVSATDASGNSVPFSQVKVSGSVDTSKAGNYQVTYSYGGKKVQATVTVKENLQSIKVKDSTIHVGDIWQASDNFVSATDVQGNSVPFSEVQVSGNVNTDVEGVYEVEYRYGKEAAVAKITVENDNTQKIFSIKQPAWSKQAKVSQTFAGVQHDRQDLGFIVNGGATLRVRQTNPKYNHKVTLRMYGKNREIEDTVNITEEWTEIKPQDDQVPFIDTPWQWDNYSETGDPEIEFKISNADSQELLHFKEGEDEDEFFDKWEKSGNSYALIQSDKMQILCPYEDLEAARTANGKLGLNSFLEKYDEIIKLDERDTGLDDSSELDAKANTRIFVRRDDRGKTDGSTAFFNPRYIASEGGLSYFFGEWWPHLEHEIGHAFQIGVGGDGGLPTGEVANEVVLGLRYQKNQDYFWDTYAGPSEAEDKETAEKNMYDRLIVGNQKYSDLPNNERIILLAAMFQRSSPTAYAEYCKEARRIVTSSDYNKNNQSFSTVIQKTLSQGGKLNYTPLIERLGGEIKTTQEDEILANGYEPVAMLADIVPQDRLEEARTLVDPNYDVRTNFMVVTNDEIASLGLTGNLTVNLQGVDLQADDKFQLKSGNQVISEVVPIDGVLQFNNVPNGVYQLSCNRDLDLGKERYVYVKDSDNPINIGSN